MNDPGVFATHRQLAEELARLRADCARLTDINGTLALANVTLRAKVTELEEEGPRARVLQHSLDTARKDCDALRQELNESEDRVEYLEAASDPEAISENVHDFLRANGYCLPVLDTPLSITPSLYRDGLYEAVQKVIES